MTVLSLISAALLAPLPAPPASLPDHGIAVEGVTRYDADHLVHYAIQHIREAGETLTDHHLVEAVEILYREDGYFLAEATAYQRDGQWVLRVNEGRIDEIRIDGLDDDAARAIAERFTPLVGIDAPKQQDFDRRFLLADDLAGIDLRASLQHEGGDGAVLELHGTQRGPTFLVSLDTINIAPGTGGRLVLDSAVTSLLSTGDQLQATAVGTLEPDDGVGLAGILRYLTPLGSSGTFLEARAGTAFGERDIGTIRVDSTLEGKQAAIGIGHALVRKPGAFLMMIGEAEYRDAESRLGSSDFQSSSRALRAFLVGGHTADNGTFVEAELAASIGVSDDASLVAPGEDDAGFAHLNGVIGLALPLGGKSQVQVELAGQLAFDDLPALERYYAGHQPSLRGYGLGEAVGDDAAIGALSLDHLLEDGSDAQLSVFTFLEAGAFRQRANRLSAGDDYRLASTGAGVRAHISSGWGFESWLAVPLADGPRSDAGNLAIYARISKAFTR
ncbi:ShlB/FhaC/HecB family hemolysin secretion/activation protein [Sphingomicrobium aestuariivivum]|uniref:ShlB/FhaC/HecB family hemolysin secretion/activation protein n=1 Tax=Sphingomicrobium aestuariivivum TaxID=1582356 RepID=UPI001FD6E0B1|nr:ShlB/FhaC/HecB family hemolysin secretion/activation protein [Sphingomicrobium aestuariivivum]MCJ8189834.1 hypothetical protein [Sphingomicrobium aestuariivivum]